MINVKIKSVEVFHPDNVIGNEYYIEHFKRLDKDVEKLMKCVFGRNKRYVLNSEYENGLTMAIDVAKKILEKENLKGTDMDMIVYSSQFPEYTTPPNSIIIHDAIEGKHETTCFDINANCAGMLAAIDQTCRAMMANPRIRYALVVGSDNVNIHLNPEDELNYGNYGDASAAVILERTEEDTGYIDSLYYTNSGGWRNILFPGCGISKIHEVRDRKETLLKWTPFDGSLCTKHGVETINKILDRNRIFIEDIKAFCLSQFAYKNIEQIREGLGIQDKEKFIYSGDEYGYTATSSPIIALYSGINDGRIKRGDYILFWTIGAGEETVTMLFKY